MFDYKDLNLKIGLEIHQQLSDKKLFCNCSTKFEEKELDIEFKRKLRASSGETGKVDVAAKFEESKNKDFIYHGYKGEYCLVDCDEQPPYQVNQDALVTALSLAKLFRLNIPKEIYVMRKIITDGSACSAFQRTMLVGYESEDSFIETSFGKVKIASLCLEEDACKIEKNEENKTYYSLSRQGIPLIEIMTKPDIKTPDGAKETAEKLGMILRSFSDILRGIGTIRQDVNLSILDGSRVEIKGFQDLRTMPKIIDYEIQRQFSLVEKDKKVEEEVRKANENGTTSFLRPLPGSARMYPDTDIPTIEVSKELLENVKIPELIEDKINKLKERYGLSNELASEMIHSKIDFNDYSKKYNEISSGLLASILVSNFNNKRLDYVLDLLDKGKITKDVVNEIFVKLSKNEKINLEDYKSVSLNEIEKEIKELKSKNKELSVNALMGMLMSKYKGKIDGKKLIELINKK